MKRIISGFGALALILSLNVPSHGSTDVPSPELFIQTVAPNSLPHPNPQLVNGTDYKISQLVIGIGDDKGNTPNNLLSWELATWNNSGPLGTWCPTEIACGDNIQVYVFRNGSRIDFPVSRVEPIGGTIAIKFRNYNSPSEPNPGILPGDALVVRLAAGIFKGPAALSLSDVFLRYDYVLIRQIGNQIAGTNGDSVTTAATATTQLQQSTVTFNANLGTGSMASQSALAPTTLNANTFTRAGFVFAGWNTQDNGQGTPYADQATYPFASSTTLYAQWSSAPAEEPAENPSPISVPYEGPLNLRHQSGTLCSGGEGILSGERLNTITEIYVGDKKVAQELLPDGRLKYSLKDIAPGTYQIRYWVPVNNVNLSDQIRVGTCSTAPVATTPGAFEASRLFANYRGDRGPVIARDRAAITAFINQYQGITNVRCVGSTSGVPAKRTDPALAQARAKNACDVVKRLVPNATITLETSTGKGIGQRFRSVTIFISGTN